MSDIHVLDGTGSSVRVACHIGVPVANNLAGVSQQTAWKNSGNATASVMQIGTGAGQILQAEADALAAGTLAEIVVVVNPEGNTPAARLALLRELYTQAVALGIAELYTLRWFGATATKS